MTPYVRLLASENMTRVRVVLGSDEVLRANLPALSQVKHEGAVTRLLEAVSLWTNGRVCVALCADDEESCSRLGLTDELGGGARSVFYAVEVLPRGRPKRGGRHRGVREFGQTHQLRFVEGEP